MIKIEILLAILIFVFKGFSLQGGPVQPEYLQFEPVDNTDLINLQTGDFVYTLPLAEVKGNEGSFPIVLSYHAGIQHDQEATWVGLGWTLNPGAINRILRGYPDDWHDGVVQSHFYDEGGEKDGWGLQVGAGWGPVGLAANYDSEKGSGANFYLGVPSIFGLKAGIGLGSDGSSWGGISWSFGSASIGLNFDSETQKTTWAIGVGSGIDLYGNAYGIKYPIHVLSTGISLGSNGASGSFSVAGVGFTSQAGRSPSTQSTFNADSWNFSIPIPTPVGLFNISFGWYQWESKWWLNEAVQEHAYGYLYQGGPALVSNPFKMGYLKKPSNESSPVLQSDLGAKLEHFETEGHLVFPSQDLYSVNVQGLSGLFMPFGSYNMTMVSQISQRNLQSKAFSTSDNKPSPTNSFPKRWNFQGNNSLPLDKYLNAGNKLCVSSREFQNQIYMLGNAGPLDESGIKFRFLGDPGGNLITIPRNEDNASFTNGSLALDLENSGVAQIKEKLMASGVSFYNATSAKLAYGRYGAKQIIPILEEGRSLLRGFIIIDVDGKQYRFLKPVKELLEYSYNTLNSSGGPTGTQYSDTKKLTPFATTWLISSVTGPDFIDVNQNNEPDDGDLGYWAKFVYTGDEANEKSLLYKWRSPFDGFTSTTNLISQPPKGTKHGYIYSASFGIKELVYLKKIETSTEYAVFETSNRTDMQPWNGSIDFTISSKSGAASSVPYEIASVEIPLANGIPLHNEDKKLAMGNLDKISFDIDLPENIDIRSFPQNLNVIKISGVERVITKEVQPACAETKTFDGDEANAYVKASQIEAIEKVPFDDPDRKYGKTRFRLINGNTFFIDNYSQGLVPINCFPNRYGYRYAVGRVKFELTSEFIAESYGPNSNPKKLDNIFIFKKNSSNNSPIKTVVFKYNYDLCKNTPNTPNGQGGRLTLESIQTIGKDGVSLPPFKFYYQFGDLGNPNYDAGTNASAAFYRHDYWGMYNPNAVPGNYSLDAQNDGFVGVCWNLNRIVTPAGGELSIDYERDLYRGYDKKSVENAGGTSGLVWTQHPAFSPASGHPLANSITPSLDAINFQTNPIATSPFTTSIPENEFVYSKALVVFKPVVGGFYYDYSYGCPDGAHSYYVDAISDVFNYKLVDVKLSSSSSRLVIEILDKVLYSDEFPTEPSPIICSGTTINYGANINAVLSTRS